MSEQDTTNPGAPPQGATGVTIKSHNRLQHARDTGRVATHYWDQLSRSIQPLRALREALA